MIDKQDKVSTEHPKYAGQQAKRQVFGWVRSTDTMRDAATALLPKYPAEWPSEYNARLQSATIDGITYGGVDTLTGAVFEGEIDVSKVHPSIKPLLENIDNRGSHFDVFARDAFKAAFDGFSVIVVDAPFVESKPQSLEDQQKMGIRPYWRLYRACDVINWRYRVNPVNKKSELSLIVFKEMTEEPAGRFLTKTVTRYRVWFLDDAGGAWAEVWLDQGDGKDPILETPAVPLGTQNVIPAAFVGDVCDDPKLLVESRLEIKAYQKESSFDVIEYLSIPTFFTKGYEGEERLSLGASTHLKLPVEGDVGFAQIDAAGHESLKGTIREIKEYIKGRLNLLVSQAIGAADKTATQVATEDKDKQARLVVWANELKDALELALQYTGQMMNLGADKAGEIVLKTKWDVMAEQAAEAQQRQLESHRAEIAQMAAKQ